jgi:hypothetical protein
MVRACSALILVAMGLCRPVLRTAEPSSGQMRIHAYSSDSRAKTRAQYERSIPDEVCIECHKDQAGFLLTSHHKTSQASGKDSILGSFSPDGSNVLMIADPAKAEDSPGLYFKMEKRGGDYYQTAVAGWPDQLRTRSERIDIVIGSGKRGQSYLYWHGDNVFELPVSYWSERHQWINSPGYKNGTMNFVRPITPRCMECHASFIQQVTSDISTNRYLKDSLVTGITCERCHGSGKEHVALHASALARTRAADEMIVNPGKLARDRQVDICALCHNGNQSEEKAPAFSFTPGERLDKYFHPNLGDNAEHPDVHGNQVGLLKKSRCYASSPSMSCSTCHDTHASERESSWYSSRCLTCHQVESCGMSKTLGRKIADGCIGCHMSVEPTTAFNFDTAGRPLRPTMRNHWIKIPDPANATHSTHSTVHQALPSDSLLQR